MPKTDKRIIMVVLIAAILFFAVIAVWLIFSIQKEEPLFEEMEEEKTKGLLDELTPSGAEPSNQEELNNLLEELTPSGPPVATEEEKNETENLLKELTP